MKSQGKSKGDPLKIIHLWTFSVSNVLQPNSEFDEKMSRVTWETDLSDVLTRMANARTTQQPVMVALVGVPGSGKSTSAEILTRLVPDSVVLPMDGYHHALHVLRSLPDADDLIYRRGAPDTFDAAALVRDLCAVRDGTSEQVLLPGFDHAEGDPRADQHAFVRATHRVVIVEGLYLLHTSHGWADACALFDLRVFIEADVEVCVERLKVRNRCIPGYTPEEIDARCDAVDRVNAQLVAGDKCRADLVVWGCAIAAAEPWEGDAEPWGQATGGGEELSTQAKVEQMAARRRELLVPKEQERQLLLASLREHAMPTDSAGSSVGAAIPVGALSAAVEAIAAFDVSWVAPTPLKAKRAFVDNWFEANEGKAAAYADTYRVEWIALERVVAPEEVEVARRQGGEISDYRVSLATDGTYQIRTNRTHAFCRVGYRYLLTSGEHWLELEVTKSDGPNAASDKGTAVVVEASKGSYVLSYDLEGEDGPGSICGECRLVRVVGD